MRKSALIVLAVFGVLGAIAFYFLQDRYLERAFESGGEAIVGAKVEIDDFHLSFWNLQGSWNRIQIANPNDPWKNILESGKAKFSVESRPLFWGRFIISDLSLEDVRSGTARETDGSLPFDPEAEESRFSEISASVKQQIKELPALDVQGLARELKLDSLINVQQLSTVQGYSRLSATVDSSQNFWENTLKTNDYAKQLTAIETDVQKLLATKVTDAASAAKTLKQADAARDNIRALKVDLDQKRSFVRTNIASVDSQFKSLRGALENDVEKAKRVAKLKELDTRDVGLLLFGEPLVAQVDEILYYISLARKYLPAAEAFLGDDDEPETPPRFEGIDISFPFKYRYPRFLIRQAELTAATHASDTSKAYALSGEMTGLTNEPFIFGEPTRFELDANHPAKSSFRLTGAFDHTEKSAKDSLRIAVTNFHVGRLKLGGGGILPSALLADRGDVVINTNFIGKKVGLDLGFDARDVAFDFANQKSGLLAQAVRETLADLGEINLKALLGGLEEGKLRVQSNVDNALASRIKSLLGDELQKSRQRVDGFVRAEVGKYEKQARDQVEQFRQNAVQRIESLTARIDAERAKLEKFRGDLEARVEAEKKKVADKGKQKAKDEAKKRLGGLLGKKKKSEPDTTKKQ